MTPGFLLLAVMALAAYRFWRVIGQDVVFERQRDWLLLRLPGKLDYMVTCGWCAGAYVSVATVIVVDQWFVPLPMPVLWAGAVSALVGILAEMGAD